MIHVSLSDLALSRLDNPDVFFQSSLWGSFKGQFGWKPLSCMVRIRESANGIVREFPLLVLLRRIKRFFSLAYIPYPVIEDIHPYAASVNTDAAWYSELMSRICSQLTEKLPSDCAFIRIDLPWSFTDLSGIPAADGVFRKAVLEIQPSSSVIVDLTENEDSILSAMKPKTRYNIRLAEKKGLEVVEGTIDDLDEWYMLYQETARRDRIALHHREYYHALFETASKESANGVKIRLLLARVEGQTIAGIILLIHGNRATYLYGASSNQKRNYMPAYALQWYALRLSRLNGCVSYDMFGIPPDDNPDHPMAGLYRFKTGFGGTILHRPGCWDYPVRKMIYRVYRGAETLRYFYHKKWTKQRKHGTAQVKQSDD